MNVSGGTFGGIGEVGDPEADTALLRSVFPRHSAVCRHTSHGESNSAGTLYYNGDLNVAAGTALDFDFGGGTGNQSRLSNNGNNSTWTLPSSLGSVPVNLTNVNGLTGTFPLITFANLAPGSNTGSLTIGSAAAICMP